METNTSLYRDFESPTEKNREELTDDVIEFLDNVGAFELLSNSKSKREWMRNLTAEEAEQHLERLNGILIGKTIKDRDIYNEQGVLVDVSGKKEDVYRPPSPETSKKVFQSVVFPVCKQMSPNDAAELMSTSINLLHMFPDGNGRLARLVYMLFCESSEGFPPEVVREFLRSQIIERQGSYNWNPYLIMEDLDYLTRDYIDRDRPEYKGVTAVSDFPKDILTYKGENPAIRALSFGCRIKDSDIPTALIMHAKNAGFDRNTVVGEGNILDNNAVLCDINESSAVDILNCLDTVKMLRVLTLVNVFKNPDNYPSRFSGVNLKRFFEILVKAQSQYKEESEE